MGLIYCSKIMQILFGGGIAFVTDAVIIFITALGINYPLPNWQKLLSGHFGGFIAKLWKYLLGISIIILSLLIFCGMFGVPFMALTDAEPFLLAVRHNQFRNYCLSDHRRVCL